MDSEARPSDSSRELTIVSGAHRGATFALNEDILLIGADAACDVWLSDAGLASRHAAFTADGRGIAVRPLEGVVIVDAQALAPNAREVLVPGSEIVLGESGVRLRVGREAVAPDERSATGTQSGGTERAVPDASRGTRGAGGKPRLLPKAQSRLITASLLVFGGILAAGLAIQQLRPAAAAETHARQVASDAVLSDAELIAQIRDTFRSNGYDAEVTTLGRARMRIENLDAGNERVKRAVAQARADIPQLQSLTIGAPDSAAPPKEAPLYDDAADHMSLHVEGETAYLAARDGRYFAGSTLPNGDTIRRITSGAVQIERDGQFSWFRF